MGVSSNRIADSGARSISESLLGNTTLSVLNLSHNDIGDDGAVALAGFVSHTRIRSVCLHSNPISTGSMRALEQVTNIDGWQPFSSFSGPLREALSQISDNMARSSGSTCKSVADESACVSGSTSDAKIRDAVHQIQKEAQRASKLTLDLEKKQRADADLVQEDICAFYNSQVLEMGSKRHDAAKETNVDDPCFNTENEYYSYGSNSESEDDREVYTIIERINEG